MALENAITKAVYGKPVDDISKEIERTLKEKDYKPVYNLGGHGLGKYDIHSLPSIPNHSSGTTNKLEEGAIAIEPFATTGNGFVSESSQVEIFSLKEGKNVRNAYGRKIIETAKKYSELPFAERWLAKEFRGVLFGLQELAQMGKLRVHYVLSEKKGAFVAQTEETILITEDGYEQLT